MRMPRSVLAMMRTAAATLGLRLPQSQLAVVVSVTRKARARSRVRMLFCNIHARTRQRQSRGSHARSKKSETPTSPPVARLIATNWERSGRRDPSHHRETLAGETPTSRANAARAMPFFWSQLESFIPRKG